MKILIAGDFCPRDRVSQLIELKNYSEIFSEVVKFTSSVDFSVVNLEAPVVKGEAFPIDKCGPNLKCTPYAVEAIKYAGFKAVTLANNHIYDFGEVGITDTLSTLNDYQIEYMGGGRNIQEASSVFYKKIGDKKIAVINCCEHEFSIATECTGGANPLNPIKQFYFIQEAKNNADFVLVIVHGGHEHYQLPSPRMKDIYRFFIDAGADSVINHHQHCFSGYEIYKQKPIFYGLGNFCFDSPMKRNSIWNEGYLLLLSFVDGKVSFEMHPYIQGDNKIGVKILSNKDLFFKKIECLNRIIENDVLLEKEYRSFMKRNSKAYLLSLSPYQNHFFRSLFLRGFLPLLIGKRKALLLFNLISCESHVEKLLFSINSILKK